MLRTPYQDEPKLKSYLSRLAIALEAHAISSVLTDTSARDASHGLSSGQARDVIWAGKVNTGEEPVIVIEEAIEGEDSRDMFVIWKLIAFLSLLISSFYLRYTPLIRHRSSKVTSTNASHHVQAFGLFTVYATQLSGRG